MAHVGLQINEGVSNGVSSFVESSKYNVGLIFERERGIPNKPIKVTSLQEDRVRFGGIVSDSQYGAFVTRQLFNNASIFGATVYGVRLVDDTSVAASKVLSNGIAQVPAATFVESENQAPAVGPPELPAILHYTPANVHIGDIFRMTVGTTTISYTALSTSVAAVCSALDSLINLEISTNPTGDWATLLAGSIAGSVSSTATELVVTGPDHDAIIALVTPSLTAIGSTIFTVKAGQVGYEDPGTWGNGLSVSVYPKNDPLGLAGKYLLKVYYKSVLVESWSGDTWASLIALINSGSYYITITATNLTLDITAVTTITLEGGTYVAPASEAAYEPTPDPVNPTGLACFDGVDVQIIACPDLFTDTFAATLRDYAELNGKHAVFCLPNLADDTDVATFSAALQTATRNHIAVYNLWTRTSDEAGSFVWTPGYGQILGAGYIRVPQMNGDFVWIPPAGVDSAFKDCIDIYPAILSQSTIDTWVQRYTTNVAVFKQGKGFILYSSRTMSTNPLYHSVHVSRMTDWLISTLNDNMLFTIQKPNTPSLQREATVSLIMFGKGIYDNAGLERSVSFDESWKVICDQTVNPPTQDRKILRIRVEWIPTECTESVVIELNRNDGSLVVQAIS